MEILMVVKHCFSDCLSQQEMRKKAIDFLVHGWKGESKLSNRVLLTLPYSDCNDGWWGIFRYWATGCESLAVANFCGGWWCLLPEDFYGIIKKQPLAGLHDVDGFL